MVFNTWFLSFMCILIVIVQLLAARFNKPSYVMLLELRKHPCSNSSHVTAPYKLSFIIIIIIN